MAFATFQVANEETRTACIDPRTGELFELRRTPIEIIRRSTPHEEVRAHYGDFDLSNLGRPTGSSLNDLAEFYFRVGKQILQRDGFHHPMVLLWSKKAGYNCSLRVEDYAQKYLVWRSVAADVDRLGVTAVIAISEAWFSPFDPQHPERHAVDSPERREVLALDAASENGTQLSITCEFERVDGKIVFGEERRDTKDQIGMFLPIYEVWKKKRTPDSVPPSPVARPTGKKKRRKRKSP